MSDDPLSANPNPSEEPQAAAGTDAVSADTQPGELPTLPSALANDLPGDLPNDLPVELDQAAIEELLKQASFDDPNAVAADSAMDGSATDASTGSNSANADLPTGERFPLPNFQQVMADAQVSSIDLLRDVELNVKIELGRSRMLVEDVLKLGEGSVVELDKLAGDPVDVFVNDRLVARGEVLVLNENFCVRVNEIIAGVKDEGI